LTPARWLAPAVLLLWADAAEALVKAGPTVMSRHVKARVATGGGGGAYTGPGDVVSGAYLYVGVRAYTAAYAAAHGNAFQLTRNSDSTQCNVVLTTAGDLDATTPNCAGNTQTIIQFCTATTCLMSTGYDQTGNGRNYTYLVGSTGFPVFTAGCVNGHYCITTQAGDTGYGTATSLTVANPWTASMVASRNAASSFQVVGASQDSLLYLGYANAANTARLANTAAVTGTASDGAFHAITGVANGASSVLAIDGAETTGTAGSTGPSGTPLCVWGSGAGCIANPFVGKFGELLIYSGTALTLGQRNSIKANQSAYYGTP
jgi:hypothetical protein